ncbi:MULTISPECIES: hypothetical protein [unclassified Streptomyces]|uniref:hypothetical protein n=1 Tax=unclassified Streptomyces TaxID=2593676 RepID=UPI0013317A60|nr:MULTISPECIES: hypothetical protein [unclassified Streptomyces]MCP3766640.1 hypothetical protein [Streptomyces sp. MAR25Y5]
MTKYIDVELSSLFCDFSGTGPGDDLELFGNIAGITFNDEAVEKSRSSIYAFPDGPIRIAPNQVVEIKKRATFVLGTPSIEPPTLAGRYLKFGGELFEQDVPPDTDDRLGSSFKTVSTFDITVPALPQTHHVRWSHGSQEIRADFVLTLIHYG